MYGCVFASEAFVFNTVTVLLILAWVGVSLWVSLGVGAGGGQGGRGRAQGRGGLCPGAGLGSHPERGHFWGVTPNLETGLGTCFEIGGHTPDGGVTPNLETNP